MKKKPVPISPPAQAGRGRLAAAAAVILLAILLAYSNSLEGPFVFDDINNIVKAPSIRNTSPLWSVFFPPQGMGISERPIIHASFALNWALGGPDTFGFHLLNLLIHMAAALFLLGFLTELLKTPVMAKLFPSHGIFLAAAATLIWALHPLNTSAVTYITQRCESLMGLFFFGTMYFAAKSFSSTRKTGWQAGALVCFFLGVGSKEVVAAAPFLVLIYDWIFWSGSLRKSFSRNAFLYGGFLLGLALLFALVFSSGADERLARDQTLTPLQYLLTQTGVLFRYLRLSVWPSGLVLDYAWPVSTLAGAILPGSFLLLAFAATAWGVYRRHPLGFAGAWFFLILAPSSSFFPIPDVIFEYRMYLPLAGLAATTVLTLYAMASGRGFLEGTKAKACGVFLVLGIALVLGILTFQRNGVYQNELALWSDNVKKQPLSARARGSLAAALGKAGLREQAIGHLKRAIQIQPGVASFHYNLGNELAGLGKYGQAGVHYRKALEINPDKAKAHLNLGNVLQMTGSSQEAKKHYVLAIQAQSDCMDAYKNLGQMLIQEQKPDQAAQVFARGLAVEPGNLALAYHLARSLDLSGESNQAARILQQLLAQNPGWADARNLMDSIGKAKESSPQGIHPIEE